MTYLNVTEVESALIGLATTYPSFCELVTLPNLSIEGRTIHAVRIGTASSASRDGVLLTGGVHSREWGSSEICVYLAADLCEAYANGTGLAYGGKSFTVAEVKGLVEGLNWYVLADSNPDGRNFSQTTDVSWRHNRNPAESGGNPACIGVDLNRNQDFLWDFTNKFSSSATVNTSTSPCSGSQTYRGSAPTSEPEAKNIVWMLDNFPRIRWYVDLHSSGEMILHSWGDDESQSSTSGQNFLNVAFDAQRGVGGDMAYKEFVPSADQTEMVSLANALHDGLQAVRGKDYSIGPAFDLYATSGANDDYAYSRHFADATKGKVVAYTVEWGEQFQPTWNEMEKIVSDVSAGLLNFALTAACVSVDIADLDTPTLTFNDVPEGETTARAVVFSVQRCGTSTFQIISGPSVTSGPGSFGTLPSPTATLPAGGAAVRQARLWLSFTGTNDGDTTTGTVTVRLVETGEQWVIPITANTIARPTVAVALVLDQSGSMADPSGVPSLPTRNDVLHFSAPVFVNVLPEQDGIGIVAFDTDAYDRMAIATAGPPSAFDPTRSTALTTIAAHSPNPAGMTAIGDGIEKAKNLLDPVTGFDNKATVVFTDGHETASKYIADVAGSINDRVFAIGLGTADQLKPASLQAIANGTGGYLLMTGNLGNDDLFRLSKYYLQILAGVTNHDVVLDPDGHLLPGQVLRIPFRLNEADIETDVILLSDWPPQAFIFALETPAGDIIDPSSVGALGGQFVTGNGVSYFRMTLPVALGAGAHAGKWNAILAINPRYYRPNDDYTHGPVGGGKIPSNGLRYSLSVHSYSGLRLVGSLSQTSNEPGATVTVKGVLSEYGVPIESDRASVKAELEKPDGTKSTLTLAETDPGSYEATFTATQPGVYPIRLLANGKSMRGRTFTREHLLSAAVWQGGDNPPPNSHNPDPEDPQHHGDPDGVCAIVDCLLGVLPRGTIANN